MPMLAFLVGSQVAIRGARFSIGPPLPALEDGLELALLGLVGALVYEHPGGCVAIEQRGPGEVRGEHDLAAI